MLEVFIYSTVHNNHLVVKFPKRESSPFHYAFSKTLNAVIKRTVKWALIGTAVMELGIRSVDWTADLSGYNNQYENHADEIITGLESELQIDIPPTNIESSFVASRSAFMTSSKNLIEANGNYYLPYYYVIDYFSSTADALLMNQYLAKFFEPDSRAIAIYGNATVCFPPFDNSSELTDDERLVLAHEIMHNYVNRTNPDLFEVKSVDSYIIRLISYIIGSLSR